MGGSRSGGTFMSHRWTAKKYLVLVVEAKTNWMLRCSVGHSTARHVRSCGGAEASGGHWMAGSLWDVCNVRNVGNVCNVRNVCNVWMAGSLWDGGARVQRKRRRYRKIHTARARV